MSDQELREIVAKLAISQAKTDEQLKETDKQLKETDKQLKEASKQMKERYEYLSQLMKDGEKRRKKSEEDFNKRMEKLEKKLDKIGAMVGGISNNQGDVAEEYFVNSLKDKLKLGYLKFDYLVPNYIIEGKSIKDEYDILLINGDSVAIVEVKYKIHPNDLDKLPKKIKNLKQLPQYKNYKVYAGVAGFNVSKETIKQAKQRGYFILQRKGDIIQSYTEELKAAWVVNISRYFN